jgi:hypothetical protein
MPKEKLYSVQVHGPEPYMGIFLIYVFSRLINTGKTLILITR